MIDGITEGLKLGMIDGITEGLALGMVEGITEGLTLGRIEGRPEGVVEGELDNGEIEGEVAGVEVGQCSQLHSMFKPKMLVICPSGEI